jgi:hypothetical protein
MRTLTASILYYKMKKIVAFFLSISLVFQLNVASASENKPPNVSLPFSVSFDMPNNQDKETKAYFNLKMQPNQVQTVYLFLQNSSQEVLELNVKPSNAIMSLSGGIVYDDSHGSNYTYLTNNSYYMDQYLSLPKEVILKPNEVKRVPVTIKAPGESLGTVLGGVLFIPRDEKTAASKEQFSTATKLRLNVPIQINLPSNEKSSSLKINRSETLIFPSGANVMFELENPNNSILKGVSYEYTVKNENDKELFNGAIPPFSVAPKSKVKIPIPWNYVTYKPGKYKLILEPSYSNTKIENEFNISVKDVSTYIKKTHQKSPVPIINIPIYVWILLSILILSLIYSAYRLGKKKSLNSSILS